MKNGIVVVILIFASQGLLAQRSFQKAFGQSANDACKAFRQTSDGGYIAAGHTSSFGPGPVNAFLLKLNKDFEVQWTKSYDTIVYIFDGMETMDGGYIAGGYIPTDIINYDYDFYILKTDSNGNLLWTKTYGGNSLDICYAVEQSADSGYVFAGHSSSYNGAYVIRTDNNGDTLWTRAYGWSWESAKCIKKTNGGYVFTGNTMSYGAGGSDVYLVKIDDNGDVVWSKAYGGALQEEGNAVSGTSDGGYIVCGSTSSYGEGGKDVYVLKVDSLGNLEWSKAYGSTGDEQGNDIIEGENGGYIVIGETNSFGGNDMYAIRIDSTGEMIWAKAYGNNGNEFGYAVIKVADGGYVLGGQTTSFGEGGADVYVVKTDSTGASGCYEYAPAMIENNGLTLVNSGIAVKAGTEVNNLPNIQNSATIVTTTLCDNTGIPQSANDYGAGFFIYPNPSTGLIKLLFGIVPEDMKVMLFDVAGKLIWTEQLSGQKEYYHDFTDLSNGFYLIQVFADGKIWNEKLVIQK